MKIRDIMTPYVHCCSPETTLAAAASAMWDGDCGALPVVTVDGTVVGMMTDRDICMAVATRGRRASEITVWETTSRKVYGCHGDDDVRSALDQMARHQVRRLPVLDGDQRIEGMVSLNDIIMAHAKSGAPTASDIVEVLEAISAHRPLVSLG
jgi:CBS domain-containing protein